MQHVDVVVVGAGPAGAAAALAARRTGADVVLLDRAAFPRDKPCGDGIAPHALEVLARLGVPDPVAGYPPVQVLRLTAPGGVDVARPMPRGVHVVPREVFDARLVRAAVDAGAVLDRHAVRDVRTEGDRVVLDGRWSARVAIGADGAGSVLRRAAGHRPNPAGHVALALRGYAPAPDGPAEQRIVTARGDWPAYAWSFPIGDGRANIGYGQVLRGRPLQRAHLLERMAALLPDVDVTAATAMRGHHLPLSTRRPPPATGRVLLTGDALSLINPFTGEGIYYAVLSGALAGAASRRGARAGDAYTAGLRAALGRHLRHSAAATSLARGPAVVEAAVRAAGADQRVYDTLVEVGLGRGTLDRHCLLGVARGLLARRSR